MMKAIDPHECLLPDLPNGTSGSGTMQVADKSPNMMHAVSTMLCTIRYMQLDCGITGMHHMHKILHSRSAPSA